MKASARDVNSKTPSVAIVLREPWALTPIQEHRGRAPLTGFQKGPWTRKRVSAATNPPVVSFLNQQATERRFRSAERKRDCASFRRLSASARTWLEYIPGKGEFDRFASATCPMNRRSPRTWRNSHDNIPVFGQAERV